MYVSVACLHPVYVSVQIILLVIFLAEKLFALLANVGSGKLLNWEEKYMDFCALHSSIRIHVNKCYANVVPLPSEANGRKQVEADILSRVPWTIFNE